MLVSGPLAMWIVAALDNAAIFSNLSVFGATLYSIGIPKERVQYYEAALKDGHYLLIAHGPAREILRAKGFLPRLTEPLREHITGRGGGGGGLGLPASRRRARPGLEAQRDPPRLGAFETESGVGFRLSLPEPTRSRMRDKNENEYDFIRSAQKRSLSHCCPCCRRYGRLDVTAKTGRTPFGNGICRPGIRGDLGPVPDGQLSFANGFAAVSSVSCRRSEYRLDEDRPHAADELALLLRPFFRQFFGDQFSQQFHFRGNSARRAWVRRHSDF